MPDQEMGSDHLVPRGLPGARRGYDRHAVESLLREAREAWSALEGEHRLLLAEIERTGGLEYLARDLGEVGGDVGRLLGDAQEAARGLRERARSDSAERVAAAVAEARRLVVEAEGQAFHLRADAWAAADALLRQAGEAHRFMIAEADAEVLVVRAEAEQEAYRLVATARREAQDVMRGARFEAERTVLELQAQPERILPVDSEPVQSAPSPPEKPGGRARRKRGEAPEARHPENVIRVIQPPGARRQGGGGMDPGSYGDALAAEVEALRVSGEVEVVPLEPLPRPRVVAPARRTAPAAPDEAAAPEVAREEAAPAEAAPEVRADAAAVEAPTVEAPTAAEVAPEEAPAPEEPSRRAVPEPEKAGEHGGVVDDLFSRLRGAAHRRPTAPAVEGEEAPPAAGIALPPTAAPRADALEVRERLLLPVQNRALRRVKEGIVELQNVALDALRVSGSWEGPPAASVTLTAALDPVAEEGAEAGAVAAGLFVGGEPPAPVISARSAALVATMAGDLVGQVQAAVAGASGAGPLEVAAAVARVFRAWRSDEAERWVRAVAYAAYHDSLLAGLTVAGVRAVAPVAFGLLCPECPAGRGAAWDPAGSPPPGTARPPAHPDCVCTVAPA